LTDYDMIDLAAKKKNYNTVSEVNIVFLVAAGGFEGDLMPEYAPITIRAVDNNGLELFNYEVPFEFEITVKQLMERAFVIGQTSTKPDPFLYTLEYFGYSESVQFPGYLGYEIESIAQFQSNDQFFWSLLINDVPSSAGADTTYPGPGATVLWKYTPVPAAAHEEPSRAGAVHKLRGARRQKSR
jgi:hypothetical protein